MQHKLDGIHPVNNVDELAADVSARFDADIYLYVGRIFPPDDNTMIETIRSYKKQSNALLIVETLGGIPDIAYRIARAFQRSYQTKAEQPDERGRFLIYIPKFCKSAGTLLTLAADELIMSQFGELGPIDVQLQKDDELGERMSGLTPHQALETLQIQSGQHFSRFFQQLRFSQELGFSTKLSADIAAVLAVGLMGPVYAQLDPSRLGEMERFVRISSEYGYRLKTDNVRDNTIPRLAVSYPSHEFVIDRTEARKLFVRVTKPIRMLEQLGDLLRSDMMMWSGKSVIQCLSKGEKNDGENDVVAAGELSEQPTAKGIGRRKKQDNGQVRSTDSEEG